MKLARAITLAGKIPLVGQALRWYARRYEEGSVVTIASGHAAGLKWKRHHRYVNGYWLGTYELPIQEALARELKPGDVFYDVGANAGFFSLLAAKCVGTRGHVFAFEPLPANAQAIREMIDLNHLGHCTLVDLAVCAHVGTATFVESGNVSTARVQKSPEQHGRSIQVSATTLDEFGVRECAPNFIKMDIEGGEIAALHGATAMLTGQRPPKLLIELHGYRSMRQVLGILNDCRYSVCDLEGRGFDERKMQSHVLASPRA